jgi:arabinan endo-1,5-alpha-L-arabinosidase
MNRKLKALARLILAAGAACAAMAVQAAPWTLTGALTTHDPNLYRTSSTWWIFETTSDGGIGVKYSSDGHAWTQGVAIFSGGLSWWTSYNPSSAPAQVWAPGCGEWNGNGYCYYAVSTFGSRKSAIGLTTSAGGIAAGKWVDQGAVITSTSSSSFNAIDPSILVTDGSGTPWLSYGSFANGIYVTAVNSSTLKPTGSATNIARDTTNGIENSFIVKRALNGTTYYYLFASKGACCKGASSTYYVVVGRSTSITGPYADKSGVAMMSGGGTVLASSGTRFKGPGGQSVSGSAYIAWHAYDANNNGNPVLFMNDLTWTSDGWPNAIW